MSKKRKEKDPNMPALPHAYSHPGSLMQTLEKIVREKIAVAEMEAELTERLETENKVRRIKRLGQACPFAQEGMCGRMDIRCGERQQYACPEDEDNRRLPHKCHYQPIVKLTDFNILVVDDEPMIGELCSEFFEAAGVERDNIDRAESVAEAQEVLKQGKITGKQYCIVMTDVKMKDATGYQLVNHLVERNFNSRILLMSGYVDEKDFPPNYMGDKEIVSGRKVVTQFFRKPINFMDFTSVIRKVEEEFKPAN
jgi:CheY-like chemotaxis protein